ncbi:MAG: twin-arginine translocation signal domain-containing protein, partial [Bacteroidales bacterium]|nr:twin-arginine translocation signal domain-containing protein [Bacteroidales bacterium]
MTVNRRKFLKNSLTVAGGVGVLSTLPLNYACKRTGANDKIRIGLIGCRNMGFS